MKNFNNFYRTLGMLIVMVLLVSCGIKEKPVISNNENKAPVVEKSKLYPASINEGGKVLWGYINNRGEFIIKPAFDREEDFQDNGLALAGSGEAVGLIDENGKFVVEQKYNYISPFIEGIAIANDSAGYSAINEKGQVVFQSPHYIGDYSEGLAVYSTLIENKTLYGYVDKLGKVVIEPKYENAEKFKEGRAVVRLSENKQGLIDKTGKLIREFDYIFVGNLGEGLYSFRKDYPDKMGLMDEEGNIIKPPTFNYINEFKKGLAIASFSEENTPFKSGIINKSGEFVVKPDYNEIRYLGEDLYAVGVPLDNEWAEKGSRFGIMNSEGKLLKDYTYYGVYNYDNGLASAYDMTSTFFINKEGKIEESIKPVEGIGQLYLMDDVIKVNVDNRISYVDKSGRLIWKPQDEFKLENGITIIEKKYRPNRDILIYYPEIKGISDVKVQDEINNNLREKFIAGDSRNAKPEDNLKYNYQAGFSVKFYNKDLLNIELTGYDYPFGAAHGMPVQQYFHINLKNGKFYELKDLFKDDSKYVEGISGIIRKQIESKPDDYFPDAFQKIREDQFFIITKDSLFIYFYPYDIAPYAAGFPTFEIPYKDIMDIINTEGELWKAFN